MTTKPFGLAFALATICSSLSLPVRAQIAPRQQRSTKPLAAVLLKTDTDCNWSLDGAAKGVIKTDARLQVKIGLGQHLVEAKSIDGTLRWEKTFEVQDTNMQIWQIDLQDAPWTDPETNLTWMRRDNGDAINFSDANKYCQSLTFAGHSDWRLPSVGELDSIKKDSYRNDGSDLINGYRVKGPIYLSGPSMWSANTLAIGSSFTSGQRVGFLPVQSDGTDGSGSAIIADRRCPFFGGCYRALCVRK